MRIGPANFILCNMKGHVDSSEHIFLETACACYVTSDRPISTAMKNTKSLLRTSMDTKWGFWKVLLYLPYCFDILRCVLGHEEPHFFKAIWALTQVLQGTHVTADWRRN